MSRAHPFTAVLVTTCLALSLVVGTAKAAAPPPPTLVDDRLSVDTFIQGLITPISIAFLDEDDLFVLEKNTGRVRRVTNGVDQGVVLDLAVNFFNERGLLGIALHPDFPSTPEVFLFFTCRTATSPIDPNNPSENICTGPPGLGADTDVVDQVPLLGNRVDRFRWNGSTLVWEENLVTLRAFQADGAPTPPGQGDAGQPARGNHNGGVLRFGPDDKLYILFGDQGRRGQLQNLPSGPTPTGLGPTVPDDQFGGPQPDDEHLAGVILRINPDGTTPTDNPFFAYGASVGGEVGENIQLIYSYGLRNSFGMAFDPIGGDLWDEENGEDAFDEINRVTPGMNGGWIQYMGPDYRIDQYRQIETTSTHGGDSPGPNLQQLRWPPQNIALNENDAEARLFELPGSAYSNPEFSWKHVIAPAALGFVDGSALGPQYNGDMIVGLAVPLPEGGPLLRLQLTGNRRQIAGEDDHVDDNLDYNTLNESEDFLFGRNFGVVTDIQTGPNGNLFVVSISNSAIYEISGPEQFAGDGPGRGQGRGRGKNGPPGPEGNPNPGNNNGNNGNNGNQGNNGNGPPGPQGNNNGPNGNNNNNNNNNGNNGNNGNPGNNNPGKPHRISEDGGTVITDTSAPWIAATLGNARTIRFALDTDQRARVTLLDISGRVVSRVLDSELPAGVHEVRWPTGVTQPGMYFLKLETASGTSRFAKAVVTN